MNSMMLHRVKSISIEDPRKLSPGTFVTGIIIEFELGDKMEITTFSDAPICATLTKEEQS